MLSEDRIHRLESLLDASLHLEIVFLLLHRNTLE